MPVLTSSGKRTVTPRSYRCFIIGPSRRQCQHRPPLFNQHYPSQVVAQEPDLWWSLAAGLLGLVLIARVWLRSRAATQSESSARTDTVPHDKR